MTTTTHLQGRWDDGVEHLDAAECWKLLHHAEIGRLAVSIADHPDIFPINYVVDGDSIVFRTGAGTKLAAAVLGRSVAFEIDGYDALAGDAWSVVVKGRAQQIEKMLEYFEADDLPLFPWHASAKPDIVRISAELVTGRRFHVIERTAISSGAEASEAPAKPYMPPD